MAVDQKCPKCAATIPEASVREDGSCPLCGEAEIAPEIAVPTHDFGRFHLIKPLGRGAFGEVWLATDPKTDERVAVKVSWHLKDKTQIQHVMREASTTMNLTHPNIAKVREVGRSGDRVFIVSDLVEGMTLDRWRKKRNPTPQQVVAVCGRLANVLQHAHDLGVIHRDLKPNNVIIGDDMDPYLLDFGLARNGLNESSEAIERYQAVREALRNSKRKQPRVRIMGTPAYMSPEQASGKAYCADARSDVYSLGVILYELLTGRRPFQGHAQQLVKSIRRSRATPPRRFDRRIPRDVQRICQRAMAKDPADRYQTAQAMSDDCARAAAGEPITATASNGFKAWLGGLLLK